MINYNQLVQYAKSFLISEIRAIEETLENKYIEDGEKKILSRLLHEYKIDLEQIEEEY